LRETFKNKNLLGTNMNYSHKSENIQVVLFATAAFFLPFIFSHPQWLVGTAVNMLLAFAAYNLPWKKALPIIMLPSIGALASGIVFGPMSFLLIYMIPFIWAGNFVLVWTLKNADTHGEIFAPFWKAGTIFAGALCLFLLGLLPKAFLIAMGPLQLATAIGGIWSARLMKKAGI
jgi:hypothetical protein